MTDYADFNFFSKTSTDPVKVCNDSSNLDRVRFPADLEDSSFDLQELKFLYLLEIS